METINQLIQQIIQAAIEVHYEKGPGLPARAYESCLAYEFELRGMRHVRQLAIPLIYKDAILDCAFHAGLIVEDQVLVEVRAMEAVRPFHKDQVLAYLRETGHPVGLLINFQASRPPAGVTRILNDELAFELATNSLLEIRGGKIPA
jgi:GxxExxY protein